MKQEALDRYRALLEALQEAMQDADASLKDASKIVELDQARMGRLSRMEDMQAQAMAIALSRRSDIQQKRIEGAFDRIEKGTYGNCLSCKEPIATERLDFDPTAFLCPPCAERAEAARRR